MKKTVFLGLWALLAAGLSFAQEGAQPADLVPAEIPSSAVSAPVVMPVVLPDAEPVAPAEPTVAIPEPGSPQAQPYKGPALQPLQMETRGRWAGDFVAGLTVSSGNTDGQTMNFGFDATYTRPEDKLSLFANYLESRARSETDGQVTNSITALQWRAGGRYDRDIDDKRFGFLGLEFSHDHVLQLDLRSVVSSGLGRHVLKDKETTWDVYGGLSYREDYYSGDGVEINGEQRKHYVTTETLFGQESTHEIASGTRFRQKLVVYPGILRSSGTRATLDAGLLVDINKTLSLSVKLQGRYDSMAPAPAEKYDLYFITGLSVKFGG